MHISGFDVSLLIILEPVKIHAIPSHESWPNFPLSLHRGVRLQHHNGGPDSGLLYDNLGNHQDLERQKFVVLDFDSSDVKANSSNRCRGVRDILV